MEEKKLDLSEKFSLLVIDTALRSKDPDFSGKFARDIGEIVRRQLVEAQAPLKTLAETVNKLDASLQKSIASLQAFEKKAGSESDKNDWHRQLVLNAISKLDERLQRDASARSMETNGFENSVAPSRNLLESKPRPNEKTERIVVPSHSAAAAKVDQDEDPEPEVAASVWSTIRETFRTLVRHRVLTCALFVVGVISGSMLSLWLMPSGIIEAIATIKRDSTQETATNRPGEAGQNDGESLEPQPSGGSPESSGQLEKQPASPASKSKDQTVDVLIDVLRDRVGQQHTPVLLATFEKHGVDLPARRSLSIRQIEAMTRAADGRSVAAFILQALIVSQGQNIEIDGDFRQTSAKALSLVECVANAKDLKRDTAGQLVDPLAQVIPIVKACLSG